MFRTIVEVNETTDIIVTSKDAPAIVKKVKAGNMANPFRKMDWEIDSIMREIEG